MESWDIALDAEGQARQAIKAAGPGQYRIAATVDDGKGHASKAAICSRSPARASTARASAINDLEIIPERKEYQPGEKLRLLINTNQVNSTVLLFVRPSGGVYLPPKVVHLKVRA